MPWIVPLYLFLEDTNVPVPSFNKRTDSELSQIRISESEMEDSPNALKVNKATGPDGINRMLKYTSKSISKPLNKLLIYY